MLHLGPIWYHSEPLDVPYSQNLPRPISWFGLFLQQNDSSKNINYFCPLLAKLISRQKVHVISKIREAKKGRNYHIAYD